jgi:hypothetical protein
MNLVLFASGGLCWRNTQSNRSDGRSAGELVELIRRFWFAGLVFVFLLADITSPVAAQSQQPETVTVSQAVQEAVENNLNLLAERYSLNVADARIGAARLRPNPVLSIGGDHLDLIGTGFNDINGAGPPEYSIRSDFIFERGDNWKWPLISEEMKMIMGVRNAGHSGQA